MVVLATAATVIASQALISGTFTLVEQAIALNLAPRVLVRHTSDRYKGQVFVPSVNWALALGCAVLVVAFRSSDRLASAYGLAVAFTMLCTSMAYFVVITKVLNWNRAGATALVLFFVLVDGSFVVASLPKFLDGGYIPLAISAVLVLLSLTWLEGRRCLAKALADQQTSLEDVLEKLPAGVAGGGTMVFLTPDPRGVPFLARHRWIRDRANDERIVVMNIARAGTPYLSHEQRVTVERFSLRLIRVVARFGYMEAPRLGPILRACEAFGLDLDRNDTSFFYADAKIEALGRGGMPAWRREIFEALLRNARPLPDDLAHQSRTARRARRHGRDLVALARGCRALHRDAAALDQPLQPAPESHAVEHRVQEVGRRAVAVRVRPLVVLGMVRRGLQDAEALQVCDRARRVRAVRPLVHLVRLRREQRRSRYACHACTPNSASTHAADERQRDAHAVGLPVRAGTDPAGLAVVLDVVAHDVRVEQLRAPERGPGVLRPVDDAGDEVDREQARDAGRGAGGEGSGGNVVHRGTSQQEDDPTVGRGARGERP